LANFEAPSGMALPGSRILIFTHPGSRIPDPRSRISDPRSRIQKQQQKTGVKSFFCQTIFCSHKFNKTEYYFIFDMLKKKIWPNFPRIIEVFTPKNCHQALKNMDFGIRDPGSEIRDPEKTYSGSRGQKGTGSRIPDPDPQHWAPEFKASARIFMSRRNYKHPPEFS
jgi:hypothetical protein